MAPSVAEESPSEEPKEEVETPSPEPDLEEQIRRAMERLGLIGVRMVTWFAVRLSLLSWSRLGHDPGDHPRARVHSD